MSYCPQCGSVIDKAVSICYDCERMNEESMLAYYADMDILQEW